MESKEQLEKKIDKLVLELWLALRDLSDHAVEADDMTMQDLVLWEAVTNHPAIQERLNDK